MTMVIEDSRESWMTDRMQGARSLGKKTWASGMGLRQTLLWGREHYLWRGNVVMVFQQGPFLLTSKPWPCSSTVINGFVTRHRVNRFIVVRLSLLSILDLIALRSIGCTLDLFVWQTHPMYNQSISMRSYDVKFMRYYFPYIRINFTISPDISSDSLGSTGHPANCTR